MCVCMHRRHRHHIRGECTRGVSDARRQAHPKQAAANKLPTPKASKARRASHKPQGSKLQAKARASAQQAAWCTRLPRPVGGARGRPAAARSPPCHNPQWWRALPNSAARWRRAHICRRRAGSCCHCRRYWPPAAWPGGSPTSSPAGAAAVNLMACSTSAASCVCVRCSLCGRAGQGCVCSRARRGVWCHGVPLAPPSLPA